MARRVGAVVCALMLAAAAPARADLYVDDGAPPPNTACTQAAPCDTIAKAVTAAAGGDGIQIAAGTYNDTFVDTSKRLLFVGAGAGDPAAVPDPQRDTYVVGTFTTGNPAFRLRGGGSLQGMRIKGGQQGPTSAGLPAVQLQMTAGTPVSYALRSVHLVGGAADPAQASAGAALVASAATSGGVSVSIADSTFTQGPGAGSAAVQLSGATTAMSRSTVIPGGLGTGGAGVNISGGISDFDRVQIGGSDNGLGLSASTPTGRVTITRSRIAGERTGLFAQSFVNGFMALVDVRDSVVSAARATHTANSVTAVFLSTGSGGQASLNATGTTFVTRGPDVDSGISMRTDPGNGSASATLVNSILRTTDTDGAAGDFDIVAQNQSHFTASHSSFADFTASGGADVAAPGSGTNIAGDPGLADEAGGDYSLAPGSPLVDRGDPAVVQPGELDLAGSARALDANGDCTAEPDVGAFERLAGAPCATPGGAGGGGGGPGGGAPDLTAPVFTSRVALTNSTFRVGTPAAARAAAARRGTRFGYGLSEAATVTFTIERKTTGRKQGTRCVRATRKNRKSRRCTLWKAAGSFTAPGAAGANSTPWTGRIKGKALKPARYRARLVARDAAGNKSSEKRVNLRIVRR